MSGDNGVHTGTVVPPAALNLDTLEREGGNAQTFTFVHQSRTWSLASPMDLDWQDVIAAMADPFSFFRMALPPEDVKAFFDTKLATWKMRALVDRYMAFYGVPGEGEASALPR